MLISNVWTTGAWSNWNWKCWRRKGENQSTCRKTSQSKKRTKKTNSTDIIVVLMPGFEPWLHWWLVIALTKLYHPCRSLINTCVKQTTLLVFFGSRHEVWEASIWLYIRGLKVPLTTSRKEVADFWVNGLHLHISAFWKQKKFWTQFGTSRHWRVVSLQSFENFNVISAGYKSQLMMV